MKRQEKDDAVKKQTRTACNPAGGFLLQPGEVVDWVVYPVRVARAANGSELAAIPCVRRSLLTCLRAGRPADLDANPAIADPLPRVMTERRE